MPPKKSNSRKIHEDNSLADQQAENDNDQDVSEDGKYVVAKIKAELSKLRSEFSDMLAAKCQEITALKSEVDLLKDKVARLEERSDESDAYERKDSLIFSGDALPAFATGENCTNVVCSLVKEKLKINISPTDVSSSHRLGKKPLTQQADRRNIIVKLCRKDLKHDILLACRDVKPNMYVNENLTPARNTIMYVLRQIRRKHSDLISGCFSQDGRVFVWVKPSQDASTGSRNVRVAVNSHSGLDQFCLQYVGKPLATFLDKWPH